MSTVLDVEGLLHDVQAEVTAAAAEAQDKRERAAALIVRGVPLPRSELVVMCPTPEQAQDLAARVEKHQKLARLWPVARNVAALQTELNAARAEAEATRAALKAELDALTGTTGEDTRRRGLLKDRMAAVRVPQATRERWQAVQDAFRQVLALLPEERQRAYGEREAAIRSASSRLTVAERTLRTMQARPLLTRLKAELAGLVKALAQPPQLEDPEPQEQSWWAVTGPWAPSAGGSDSLGNSDRRARAQAVAAGRTAMQEEQQRLQARIAVEEGALPARERDAKAAVAAARAALDQAEAMPDLFVELDQELAELDRAAAAAKGGA